MCGFLGAVDFEKSIELIYPELQKGLRAISHRGPDGSKEHLTANGYLGHNRLSIIDLSHEADQPFKSSYADAYLLFNGEIYNYKELKSNFKNINFRTSSDTEIILEGYLNFGIEFFKQLRGIYSIAIFDKRSDEKAILCRDPSGIKPFYFYKKDELYIFGSEIKAILPSVRNHLTINEDVLKSYLNLGYCTEPYTIYKEINCINPGNVIEIGKNFHKIHNLIKYDFEKVNSYSFRENEERTEEKFQKAVQRNLVADVEVAVALSGGIDSSLIYAYANQFNKNIKGLTIRFDDEDYNEEEIARIYSDTLQGNHEMVEVESELNLNILNKILLNFDQPYADSSAVNVYFLTKATGKITKVLLGGDGGDELFNGYPSQTWLNYIYNFNKNNIIKGSGNVFLNVATLISNTSQSRSVKRISDLWEDKPSELLYDWHSWFPRKTNYSGGSPFLFNTDNGIELYNTIFQSESPKEFKHKIVFDYFRKQMLSDYLRKTDMMSMLNGVEYRVPILDEDLTEFALTIPFEQKSSLRETKKILRSIHKKKYPSKTSSAPKKGFTIPLDTSLSKDEFNFIKEKLMVNGNIVHQYIKKDYIEYLFKGLDNRDNVQNEISRAGIYQRILMLYSLSIWDENK
ncbi:MAG: asparagine synthase (glutamine-hydrolyzing) [Ignavibacteria bacterium]|nr:asparagine synthase (glutamine-hydrolyzing) [Ignavibacteria bacterium]